MFIPNVDLVGLCRSVGWFILLFLLNCVHSNVPNQPSDDYFNRTIQFRNDSFIIQPFINSFDLVRPSSPGRSPSFDLIESSTSLSVVRLHDGDELLPKPLARVQQKPQHTRSRTGGTTIDLATNGEYNKPTLQYLNQTRPQSAHTYVASNQDLSTVRKVGKNDSKVTDLHIGALFPMTSSHSSGWLGGQGCRPASK